jgi:hypothetical protein
VRTPRPRSLTLAVMIGAALALLIPASARAEYYGEELDYAVRSDGPTGEYYCTDVDGLAGAYACFKPYGDVLFIKDTRADGHAAVAEWGIVGNRWGSCVNTLGSGSWGKCNKNFPEGKFLDLSAARYDSGNFIARGNTRVVCCT